MAKYRKLPFSLPNLVMLEAIAGLSGQDHPNSKLREAGKELQVDLKHDLLRFLQDGGFQSYGGFQTDIAPEREAFIEAATALHRKTLEAGMLYLDANGLPHDKHFSWHNNSRDAD